MKAAAAVVPVALIALCIGGCGGGGGDSSDAEATAAPLTKGQFIKQAEAVCQKGLERKDHQVKEAAEKEGGTVLSGSPKELRKLVGEALVPAYSDLIGELKDLNPPAADRATVTGIIKEYDAGLQAIEKDPNQAIQENPFTQPDKNAANFGLTSCIL